MGAKREVTKKLLDSRSEKVLSGCWLWMKPLDRDGYGRVCVDGKNQRVHRVSYRLYKGDIPNGMIVCHECDTPACINPEHLFLGTHLDNVRDKITKGRDVDQKGTNNPHSKLTEADVIVIRQSSKLQRELAKEHGVVRSTISAIISRKTWSHIQ